GAEARLYVISYTKARVVCTSAGCDARGPLQPTKADAGERWNDLMRPRPVASWSAEGSALHYLWTCGTALGYVQHGSVEGAPVCHAVCGLTGEGRQFQGDDVPSARAWLEERVRAAGFEIREDVSDG